jgi:hypothetical protein
MIKISKHERGLNSTAAPRGRAEGEGFVRFSIASSILQVILIPLKIATNRVRKHYVQR